MKKLIIIFTMLIPVFAFAGTAERQALLEEYEILIKRIKYAGSYGFCFDGKNKIEENSIKNDENSFFIKKPNVYLKVIDPTNNKIYYTRGCYLQEQKGKLVRCPNYQIYPNIKLDGHWKLCKMGAKLFVNICNDITCKNIELPLYEINENPIRVIDSNILEFSSNAKIIPCTKPDILIGFVGVPNLDKNKEVEKMKALFKKNGKIF